MPKHTHSLTSITGYDDLNWINGDGQFHIQNSDTTVGCSSAKNASYKYGTTGTTGGSSSHTHGNTGSASTWPCYQGVYMWRRTA